MQLVIIQKKIHEVRGQKVMLDFDLAILYEVETRALKSGSKTKHRYIPRRLYVPINSQRVEKYVITICDDIPQ